MANKIKTIKPASKIGKITNIIIISIFSFIIVSGLLYNLYLNIFLDGKNVDYAYIFFTLIFLIVYILSENIYESKLNIIPPSFYYIGIIFAFFSVYLGSFLNFYEKISWWDTLLHFSSGILIGLTSIIFVNFYITTKFKRSTTKNEIFFIVAVGMLASISVGVFWEFYEFAFDFLIPGGNMQRGLMVKNPVTIEQFTPYISSSGRMIGPDLKDTMSDLSIAVLGAFIAAIHSYNHLKKSLNQK